MSSGVMQLVPKMMMMRTLMMMNDDVDRSMGSPTVLRPFLMRLP